MNSKGAPRPQSESEILDAYQSGRLLGEIFSHFRLSDEPDFLNNCIKLHNAGAIDLLALTEQPEFEAIDGHRFFCGQHFFCNVIPKLNATTRAMMRCVDSLVKKGGNDMVANQPNASFREWCKADLGRAIEIVDDAKNGDPLAQEFVTFALIAGEMGHEAKAFVETYAGKLRLFGIAALGRMEYAEVSVVGVTLTTLLKALDADPDEGLRVHVLLAALDIAKKANQLTSDVLLSIVRKVCAEPSPEVNGGCARALWLHYKEIGGEMVELLLQPLYSIDPVHKRTIDELDHGLRGLLSTSNATLAIEFVQRLLSLPSNPIALTEFEGFSRDLVRGPKDRFHKALVTWLLSATRALCEGLTSVLRNKEQRETPINLTIQDFNLSTAQQIFLCRKAIGYFFLQPVIAASILTSVLRASEDDVTDAVCKLMFDPLLLNYGGAVRDYLKSIGPHDAAYLHVQSVLDQGEAYLAGLKDLKPVKEIHPSEHERQVERLRFHDHMRQAQKEAEKASVLLNFVKRSVILYGKHSITYIEDSKNERRPVEMELKSHGVTIEWPRMEIIDPVGLDYMLRVFRVERLESLTCH